MKTTRVTVIPDRYTRDTFDPSRYRGLAGARLQDTVIEVRQDGLVLDLSGVTLDGEGKGGVGIRVQDCEDVTIENGVITGFHYGIQVHNVGNLNIRGCVVSDNTNPTDAGWLPDTVAPVEEGFGGGIYLYKVRRSAIENNQLNNNFNGLSLVQSEHNVLRGNNASYCGNVGIYLLRSSHNEVLHNLAEHCIRYTGRFWCDTADSAGILLEDGSNHNRIVGNSLRYSGDGFFIRAPHNREPSNHNFISGNDGSYSPNNAFEAVFSSENVFEDNVANYSNYGFWLGYSTNTTVKGNEIRACRFDGIAIEHGQDNRIEENRIERNRNGIRLWSGPPKETFAKPPLPPETVAKLPLPAEATAKLPLPAGEGWGEGESRICSRPLKPSFPGNSGVTQKSPPEGQTSRDLPTRRYTISGNQINDSRDCGISATEDHQLALHANHLQRNRTDHTRQGL